MGKHVLGLRFPIDHFAEDVQPFCQVQGSGGCQFRVLSQLTYALLTGISRTYLVSMQQSEIHRFSTISLTSKPQKFKKNTMKFVAPRWPLLTRAPPSWALLVQ